MVREHRHGLLRRAWDAFCDWLMTRPPRKVYAHMDFEDPEDFRAACRAVRDRHLTTTIL